MSGFSFVHMITYNFLATLKIIIGSLSKGRLKEKTSNPYLSSLLIKQHPLKRVCHKSELKKLATESMLFLHDSRKIWVYLEVYYVDFLLGRLWKWSWYCSVVDTKSIFLCEKKGEGVYIRLSSFLKENFNQFLVA